MVTAEELVVEMKQEGVNETVSGIEQVEGSFDDAADSVGESADEMNSFASQWSGAMGAVVAGLAVASAGLLSQVPVIGEVFAGLVSVIDAIAFQMDKVLRPVLTPISNAFFDLSSAIFELEGPLGTIVGVVATVAAGIGVALGVVAAFSAIWGVLAGAAATLISILGTVAGAILALNPITLAIIAVIALLIAAWVLFEDEIRAIIGFAIQKLQEFWDFITEAFANIGDTIRNLIADGLIFMGRFVNGLIGFATQIKDRYIVIWTTIKDIVVDLLKSMANLGIAAVESMINGIINLVNSAIGALEGMINTAADLASRIPGVDIEGADFERLEEVELGRLETQGVGNILQESQQELSRRDQQRERQQQRRMEQFASAVNEMMGTEEQTVSIDGRRLNEQNGRYRSDETASRGYSTYG